MGGHRRWGWHELDARWAERLVVDAALPRRALVLDIGAGTGALTVPLLEAGARVVAFETHPGRARVLVDRAPSATVVRADVRDLQLPRRGYHVVSNPPFAVTSDLLRRLLQRGSRLLTAHLVLQDQAARRWSSADAPAWRRWSQTFAASLGPVVPPRAFAPPPRVGARVLVIRRLV